MARRDAAHGENAPLHHDWPTLGETPPSVEPSAEIVYLWSGRPEPDALADSVPRADYLAALVGLVDELTQRLVDSEWARGRAEAERDAALALSERRKSEATEAGRQLLAYCRSLVDSNCALDEARAEARRLAERLAGVQTAVGQLAQTPLALPLRARLQALTAAPADRPEG